MDRPEGSQPHYGEHLGDIGYWRPFVREVLLRHDLPDVSLEAPFVGTFPTFLAGEVVVKLFGPLFEGEPSHEVECEVHRLLAPVDGVPAPRLIASGALFDESPRWPYTIQERSGGVAIRDAGLSAEGRRDVAADVGRVVAALQQLPAPVFRSTWLVDGLQREKRARSLPAHLVEQIPDYLADALPATTFCHGDITEDHVMIDRGRLVAVIDWGDSLLADPYYELVPLFFGAFAGDRAAHEELLNAAGWVVDGEFAKRFLQASLSFQFDPFHDVDTRGVRTLDELAERLWP